MDLGLSATMWRHSPVRHLFYELEADLGLSDPSHSPENTRVPGHQSTTSTVNKNLLKFVEYIFPSSKEWTRVWLLEYHLFASIGRKSIGSRIVLRDEIITKSYIQLAKKDLL